MNGVVNAANTDVLLEARQLNAWYGAAHILFDVSLNVRRGEVVALMGRNGAGKSTTLKAIMGLLERRSGQVRFCGRDISHYEAWQIARLGLGYVPEDRRIFTGRGNWRCRPNRLGNRPAPAFRVPRGRRPGRSTRHGGQQRNQPADQQAVASGIRRAVQEHAPRAQYTVGIARQRISCRV